jgi:hypothetical protein
MNKLDMNLFAFVAWLGRNQHSHSISGLTIDDGYEWYNHMWNQWLKNSDAGREIMNGEITTGRNNNPDTNTSTTGNISDNMWTKTLTNDRIMFETDLWNKTVNWDKNNNVNRVTDEEQAPYNVKTRVNTVSKPDETNDGTIAVIEITVKVKQQ